MTWDKYFLKLFAQVTITIYYEQKTYLPMMYATIAYTSLQIT